MEGLNNNFVESVIPLRAIKSAVEFQHSHENMDLLNSLTTSGSSIQYLGGDGQYHDFPESFYVDAFLLKYNNDAGNVTAAKDIDGNLYMQAENTFASALDNKVIGSIELERESDKQVNVSIAEVDVNSGVVSENDLKYLTIGTGARLNFENGILSLDLDQSEAPFVNMMEKQVSAVVGDIGVFDAYGSVIDVGVSLSSLATSSQLATHAEDTSLHVTSELQSTWNAKQVALTSGQLAATNSGITAEKVVQYDAYATNKQSVGGNLPNMNLVTDDNGNITTAAPFVPSTKISTVPTAVQNRVATFTSDGNVKDSGIILGAFSSNETVKEYLDNAVSSSITGSPYQGTFTYFGTQVQVESVSTAVAGDTAIVYLGSITNLEGLLRGDYNGSTWAFADVSPAPSNGAWMETDNLLGNDPVVPGRIIVKMDGVNPPALDVRPNTTMQLDNVTIGLNSAGRVSLVMKMLSSGKSVMNTLSSDSIAYEFTNTGGTDTSKTIKEVIDANKEAAEPAFTKNTAFNKNFDTSSQSATSLLVIGNNDTRLTDARSASDVYAWAKAATKPTYTYSEVGALGADKVVQSQSTAVDTVPCSALLRNSSFARVYKDLADLGTVDNNIAFPDLAKLITQNKSYALLRVFSSDFPNAKPFPTLSGTFIITRNLADAVKAEFITSSRLASEKILFYYVTYIATNDTDDKWCGWKQTFTTDNISTTMPISSASASNEKVYSEKLAYDQLALKAPLANPTFTGQILRRPEGDFSSSGIYGQSLIGTYFLTHTVNTNVTQFAEMNISGVSARQAIDLKISSYYPADAIYDGQLMVTIDVYRSATSGNPEVNIKGTSVITPTDRFGAFYWTFDGSIIKFFYKAYTSYRYVTATVAGMSGWSFNANMFKFLSPLVDTGSTAAPATPSGGSAGQFLHTDYTQLAPTNNPTFTGTVTVPAPTNPTDAANKAYVDSMVIRQPDKAYVLYHATAGANDLYLSAATYAHTYASAGAYLITISGTDFLATVDWGDGTSGTVDLTGGFNINSQADKDKYIEVHLGTNCAVIGTFAFFNCGELTSITIPNSVISIGNYAFNGCIKLTSITIPDSVTSIGNAAFGYCYELTSITIPNSVISIGNNAFQVCSGLTSITIPNSVTSIGNNAFQNCSGLTSITIGNSVTSIGNSAFRGCSGLTSITIPNSVTSIGTSAFDGCYRLTSVNFLGNALPTIASTAFSSCRIADITAQTSSLADSAATAITTAGGTLLTNYRKLY